MHIGIRPTTEHRAGGTFQYGLTMLDALCRSDREQKRDEFSVFYHPRYTKAVLPAECGDSWVVRRLPVLPYEGLAGSVRRRARAAVGGNGAAGPRPRPGGVPAPRSYEAKKQRYLGRSLRKLGIELMLFPSALPESFESGIPFVVAIHDLQHLLQPEFPEVSADGQFEAREYLYRNAARYATLVLADSEVGRDDIVGFYERYGATADRVKVLPFLPAHYLQREVVESEKLRVRQLYALPERYLFYPANFWPHKNHARIVEAIGRLQGDAGLAVHVAFTGTSTDALARETRSEVDAIADRYGIAAQVLHLGHIPDSDMSGLYAGACALVMPTFFGPTNIPVLEAWASGCPVLTSDIRGIREQVDGAGLLARPDSVDEIAEAIRRLWTDEDLRRELVSRGRKRLSAYTPEDYRACLDGVLSEAKARIARRSGQKARVRGLHS